MIDNNGATTEEQKIEPFKLDSASGMLLPNLKPSKPSHFNPPGQSNALSPRRSSGLSRTTIKWGTADGATLSLDLIFSQ